MRVADSSAAIFRSSGTLPEISKGNPAESQIKFFLPGTTARAWANSVNASSVNRDRSSTLLSYSSLRNSTRCPNAGVVEIFDSLMAPIAADNSFVFE